MPEERRRLICEVTRLQEEEHLSFRQIARRLGISKSWACDLYKKWTPALESGLRDERRGTARGECVPSNNDTEPAPNEPPGDAVGVDAASSQASDGEAIFPPGETPSELPVGNVEGDRPAAEDDCPASLTDEDGSGPPVRRSILDLPAELDAYGERIYVGSRCPHTGKPALWYKLDKKGHKRRFTRSLFGTTVQHLDAGPIL
jgi:hypothetical protein